MYNDNKSGENYRDIEFSSTIYIYGYLKYVKGRTVFQKQIKFPWMFSVIAYHRKEAKY